MERRNQCFQSRGGRGCKCPGGACRLAGCQKRREEACLEEQVRSREDPELEGLSVELQTTLTSVLSASSRNETPSILAGLAGLC